MQIRLEINSKPQTFTLEGHETLLDLLREQLGLFGTKRVCDEGECGQCTVLLDGLPVFACILLAGSCRDCSVETIEGLAQGDGLHAVQQRLLGSGTLACGFCAPAWALSLKALLQARPDAGQAARAEAVSGVICRCTS
jgi:aerobic-type carbon monoxide dehydrogenase small subunit (CoxS/CutS family)